MKQTISLVISGVLASVLLAGCAYPPSSSDAGPPSAQITQSKHA